MPIMPRLEFSAYNLVVRYRASATPQALRIVIRTGGIAETPVGPMVMKYLQEHVRVGTGAGAEFDPRLCAFDVMEGPVTLEDSRARGPDYEWTVGVCCLSPKFMRRLVEGLRIAGGCHPVLSMSIEGSLPLDDSPLSMRTDDVRVWLESPDAYLGAWPDRGFPFEDTSTGKSAHVRLRLKEKTSYEVAQVFVGRMFSWSGALADYANARGDARGFCDYVPRAGYSKQEFRACFDLFDYRRQPALDMLSNILCRFHHEVAAIDHAEVGLPG